jgi:hypothetical protein
LRQAGNGGNQHRAEHEAYDADDGNNGTLKAGQALAFWVVKKVRKFLVDLDHWQKPGEACAKAPKKPLMAIAHSLYARFEINRAEERDAYDPSENAERVCADAEARDPLKEAGPNIAPSFFRFAYPHAAEIANLIGGVAVACIR